MTEFDRAIALDRIRDGLFRGTIDGGWSAPLGPNGGYIAALVLRALEQTVGDPERAPRSLTCHYLRPPADGPCEVHVAVEREGRSVTSLSARLEQDGRTMAMALAAFARDFPSAADFNSPPPDVPAPDDLRAATGPSDASGFPPPIARRVAVQRLFGPRPLSGGDEALIGGWIRTVDPRPADAAAVALYADAWMPASWTRLTALAPAPTIDLTIHFRARLPHDDDPAAPVLARFHSTTSRDGFVEEDGALWATDGTLLAHSRQLALLRPA